MRKKPKTILLAKIRRQLRQARGWLNLEHHWKDYKVLDRAEKGIAKAAESIVNTVNLAKLCEFQYHTTAVHNIIVNYAKPNNWLTKLLWKFLDVKVGVKTVDLTPKPLYPLIPKVKWNKKAGYGLTELKP